MRAFPSCHRSKYWHFQSSELVSLLNRLIVMQRGERLRWGKDDEKRKMRAGLRVSLLCPGKSLMPLVRAQELEEEI